MRPEMATIHAEFQGTQPTNSGAAQLKRSYYSWIKGLGWYEKNADPESLRFAKQRLSAFRATNQVNFGAETRATIRKGSKGPDVVVWQQILGVDTDGNFGSGTETATKTWQSNHGLTADGVVGPATWAAVATSGSAAEQSFLGKVTAKPKEIVASVKSSPMFGSGTAIVGMAALGIGAAIAIDHATAPKHPKRR